MIGKLIILIFIEIIILYIVLRSCYIYHKKKEIENDYRILQLEKRMSKFERKVKNNEN